MKNLGGANKGGQGIWPCHLVRILSGGMFSGSGPFNYWGQVRGALTKVAATVGVGGRDLGVDGTVYEGKSRICQLQTRRSHHGHNLLELDGSSLRVSSNLQLRRK